MDETTMRNANRILLRFVDDEDAKVRYGLKLRQAYFEAIERGEVPNDYRSTYISDVANRIFGWLADQAEDFEKRYPQDRLSSEDLKDILLTAHSRLVAKTTKG